MSWNLKELRNLIEEKYGNHQLEKANPHINSVDWKIRISSYHSYASTEAFKSLFAEHENEAIQAVKFILSSGEEATKFYEARLIAEANLIACAQSMHSVSDIFAYVIIHSLKIDGICNKDITLKTVHKHLEASALKDEIIKLLGLREFCYLKDFVNTTKHISLIFSGYNANLEDLDKEEHGLKLSEFSYEFKRSEVREYSEKWHDEFLKELNNLSFQYVEIGKEINNYLINKT